MSERNDGGPAFPTTLWEERNGVQHGTPHDGMSLRDYFAGQAMAGFLSQSHAGPKDWTAMGYGWGEDCANDLNRSQRTVVSTLSVFAYAVADAMLAARSK